MLRLIPREIRRELVEVGHRLPALERVDERARTRMKGRAS
jgi:hypothetical protein